MLLPLGILFLFLLAALTLPLIPQRRRRQAGFAGFPAVTLSLVFLNGVIFAATLGPEGRITDTAALAWGLIPRGGSFVTLLTHMFLHGDIGHIFYNMLWLWLFGPHVEEALGKLEYLLFYIGSGIAGGLLHLLITVAFLPGAAAHAPLIGASGAIAGVMGLFAIRFWRARVRLFLLFQIPAIVAGGAFILFEIVKGILSLINKGDGDNVANWAHVGGFLFGMLIALPLRMREESRQEYDREDAEKAAAAGDLNQAATHYHALLGATPEDPTAHHALANILIQQRQAEAAHRHLTDALRLFLRQGNSPGAARVYADALESFETFPLPPHLLARVASACDESGQYALSLRALSELCRDHPESREAEMGLLRLGRLHLEKLKQPRNAAAIFAEFLSLYPSSEWGSHALRLRDDAERAAAQMPPPPAIRTTGALGGGSAVSADPTGGFPAAAAAPPPPSGG